MLAESLSGDISIASDPLKVLSFALSLSPPSNELSSSLSHPPFLILEMRSNFQRLEGGTGNSILIICSLEEGIKL
ncbi:hypothetical protein J5N97_024166 [Dioscorea zingiberensis]|uniref:Uncharacterized protein n=1 Tax=Dioscorea zingiberensis TaxID=325984 RepID=A0A9D5H8J4_9LILI|nr:hypothetical protein J5N97_024166 [Dioscorea zingiberensis]